MLVHGAGVRANIFRPPVETTLVDLSDRERLRRLARELARQHRLASEPVDPRPGRPLRPSGGGQDRSSRNGSAQRQGGGSLPGVDELHDVRRGRPGAAGDHDRQQCRLPPSRGSFVFGVQASIHPADPSSPDGRAQSAVGPRRSQHSGETRFPSRRPHAPRVRQCGLQAGQLHLRKRFPGPLAPREPESGDPRLAQAGVRERPAHLLRADGALRRAGIARPRGGRRRPAARLRRRARPRRTRTSRFSRETGTSAFFPKSQVDSFEYFTRYRKDRCSLHILPGYGHLDVFLGQNAVRDTFPDHSRRARRAELRESDGNPANGSSFSRGASRWWTEFPSRFPSTATNPRLSLRFSRSTRTEPGRSCRATKFTPSGSGRRRSSSSASSTIGSPTSASTSSSASRSPAPTGRRPLPRSCPPS